MAFLHLHVWRGFGGQLLGASDGDRLLHIIAGVKRLLMKLKSREIYSGTRPRSTQQWLFPQTSRMLRDCMHMCSTPSTCLHLDQCLPWVVLPLRRMARKLTMQLSQGWDPAQEWSKAQNSLCEKARLGNHNFSGLELGTVITYTPLLYDWQLWRVSQHEISVWWGM